jgi:predicted RNA binding protein YcfA (HicA-like mRNA interferase family)
MRSPAGRMAVRIVVLAVQATPASTSGAQRPEPSLERLLRQASACGWQVTRTRGGHGRLLHPGGGTVMMSGTPSDRRALLNMRVQMRRVAERGTAA